MRHTLFSNLLVPTDPAAEASRPMRGGFALALPGNGNGRHAERISAISGQPLRVMKFGGTSVGDACCIRQVAEIIINASRESEVVVVVSAMRGVTDKLIEAAKCAEAGERKRVEGIFGELRSRHEEAARILIRSEERRKSIAGTVQDIFEGGHRLCHETTLRRELTAKACDAISSLGERLCAPLVAAALAERGAACEAIDATEVVVTDAYHGAAEPCMDATRERCRARLSALLERGAIPVVTGFIGATADGALTTLGRGGSDYSATIVGAALNADEVIIWTDVDGLLTADPRIVSDARIIAEISYPEASALAGFGAKVLHPKTIHALTRSGIPVWIRNTFAPERQGTKITPEGPDRAAGVKALAAIHDAALIAVRGLDILGAPDLLHRTLAATAKVRGNVLLAWQSVSQDDVYLAGPAPAARRAVDSLHAELRQELESGKVKRITLDPAIALITGVGQATDGAAGVAVRTLGALDKAGVSVTAVVQGLAEYSISFVVAQKHMQRALVAVHREFQLGDVKLAASPRRTPLAEVGDLVLEA
jgi:bifunctional aspartokinase / homoserine dehydrogenase 1